MAEKEKKYCINFYLEKSFVQRIQKIVNDPNNVFDSQSDVVRYTIKQQLPLLEKELNEKKNRMNQ